MSVRTGDVRGAGSDANVFVQIYGEKGDTGKLQLRSAENTKNKFERGRTDQFVLEAVDIGKVSHLLRTVPTFVTAHTFCSSRDTWVSYGWCLLIQGYFAWLKTMRRKQNLASALGFQKKIWCNHAFFRDNRASIWKRNAIHSFGVLLFFRIIVA